MAEAKLLDGIKCLGPKKRRTSFGISSDLSRSIMSLNNESDDMIGNIPLPVSVMSTQEIQAALKSLDEDLQKEVTHTEPAKKKRRSNLIDVCNIIEEVDVEEESEEPSTSNNARRSTRLQRKSFIKTTHTEKSNQNEDEMKIIKNKVYVPEEMPSWLLEVYQNKNYVEPNDRPLETIYETGTNRIKRPISVLRSIDFESDKYLQKRVRREKAKVKRLGRKIVKISAETESKFEEFLKSHDDNCKPN